MNKRSYLLIFIVSSYIYTGCSKDDEGEDYSLQTFHLDPREVIHRIDFNNQGNWELSFSTISSHTCASSLPNDTAIAEIKDGVLKLNPGILHPQGLGPVLNAKAVWDTSHMAIDLPKTVGFKDGIGIEIGFKQYEIEELNENNSRVGVELTVWINEFTIYPTSKGSLWDPRTDDKIHIYLRKDFVYRPFFDQSLNDWRTIGCEAGQPCENGYKLTRVSNQPGKFIAVLFSAPIAFRTLDDPNCKAFDAEIDYIEFYRLK